MKNIFKITIIALVCFTSTTAFSYEKIGGLKVHSKYNIGNFPSHWVGGRINIWGKQITRSDERKAKIAVNNFVKKYPKSFFKSELSSIFLMRDLSFYGSYWGATYKWDRIYVSYNTQDGDTVRFITRELHHELSSILMENHSFPKHRWIAATKGSYTSNNEGIDQAGKIGDGRDERASLLRRGILTTYGASDFENDVNIYAEYIFVLTKELKRHCKKYPRVAKKTKLIKEFYCSVDRRFNFCK